MQRRRNLVAADPLDLVGMTFGFLARARVVRVDRAERVARHDLDPGILFLQEAACAAHRPARPRRADEVCDLALGLLPDLWARGAVMHLWAHWIVVLVGEDRIGCRGRDRETLPEVVLGMLWRPGRGGDEDFGAAR